MSEENNREPQPVARPKTRPRQFRMDWKQFTRYLATWEQLLRNNPERAAYTSLEEASNIFASFSNYDGLLRARAISPQARKEGIEKAIEGLTFLKGFPGLSVDNNVARILSRKRGGVRPQKRWTKYRVLYDEHGAIVLPTQEVEFDLERAAELLKEYLAEVEKVVAAKEATQKVAENSDEDTRSNEESNEGHPQREETSDGEGGVDT